MRVTRVKKKEKQSKNKGNVGRDIREVEGKLRERMAKREELFLI